MTDARVPRRALPPDDESWAPGRRWSGLSIDDERLLFADFTDDDTMLQAPFQLEDFDGIDPVAPHPMATGRRFSADDPATSEDTSSWWPSGEAQFAFGLSPSSATAINEAPLGPSEPLLAPPAHPTQTDSPPSAPSPALAVASPNPSTAQPTSAIPHTNARRASGMSSYEPARPSLANRLFWPVVALAVVAAIVLAWSIFGRARPVAPSVSPKPTALSTPVAQADDFAGLRQNTSWTTTTDLSGDESHGLRCFRPSSELTVPPLPNGVQRQTMTALTGDPASVKIQTETYVDSATASKAYTARSEQLGGCVGTSDLITKGFDVTGFGDKATGVSVTQQDATGAVHELFVVLTGRGLFLADAQSAKSPLVTEALLASLAPGVSRLCQASEGSCVPTTPKAVPGPIPPAEPLGYLTAGDLPLVTPGAGTWVGAEIKPIKVIGSGCEGVPLAEMPKATLAVQRSYLLTDDPKASQNFGLDEIVYSFTSEADAKALADTIASNVANCAKGQATATVSALGKLAAPASGQLFTVDQRKTIDKVARTRVVVASVGSKVIYIDGNPTAQSDLSDASWLSVANRAVIRAKQLP